MSFVFCISTSMSKKISGWTWTYYQWGILPRLYAIRPPGPIMNLWFYLTSRRHQAPSVKSLTGNDAILVSGYLSG